jgi:non-homologous end joining protein Ku
MRPYWKGYLKLALVSCPIALHAACSTAERSLPADQQGNRQSAASPAHR